MLSLLRKLHRNEIMVQTGGGGGGGGLASAMGLDLLGIALGSATDLLYDHITYWHLTPLSLFFLRNKTYFLHTCKPSTLMKSLMKKRSELTYPFGE